jgi:hypothetical protein
MGAEATKAGFAGAATTEVETPEAETPEVETPEVETPAAGIAEGRITRAGTAELAAAGTFTARSGLAAGLVWTRLAEARAAGTGLAATRLAEARVAETRLVREAIERAAFGMTFNCRMLSRLLQGCNKPKYASGARERDKLNAVSVEAGLTSRKCATVFDHKKWSFIVISNSGDNHVCRFAQRSTPATDQLQYVVIPATKPRIEVQQQRRIYAF